MIEYSTELIKELNISKNRGGKMKFSIRKLTLAVAITSTFPGVLLAEDTVKIGALHDLTGSFNIYGIQQSEALKLAVKKVNDEGGVNGKDIEVVEYDTQSDDARYTQYANALVMRD